MGQDDVPNDYEKISYMRDSYLDIIQRYTSIYVLIHIYFQSFAKIRVPIKMARVWEIWAVTRADHGGN